MKIKELFYKQIDREIKGVIKVGQDDAENTWQELEEYVVTSELERYMNRFFDAYKRGLYGNTDQMGVWISGFFGSGKSHFLKILSYLLEDKKVLDGQGGERSASSFFTSTTKVDEEKLKQKIQEISAFSSDVDVILFNIDSKSGEDSKLNKEAIKDVFMKVFNDYLGFCGSIPFLAQFERKMDMDGDYDRFREKFREINGTSWEEAREDFYFIQDEIVETVVSLGIMSESEAWNWAENAPSSYSVSSDQFAEYVRKYCESKGDNHHILFLVDEIGQYIADDSKLMLNLQTVTEDIGTACRGKVWILVTSQQDIDSITKTMREDFSKIQGRFDTRIALSSANVDEVIRRRILYKKESAASLLKKVYARYESVIKNIMTFSDGTPEMPLYKNADDFAEVYPFIPYQFKLLGSVLTAIRQFSSSGKHLADGERSMLALFKEAAQNYENEEEEILIPFHAFYSALDDFIDHTHRIVITQASKNMGLRAFDVELLKVLFMMKHVNYFKCNVENLTTLMISKITEDRLALGRQVEESLRALCDEMLVQKNGDEYVFLTNEEQEAENIIRNISIDPAETVNYVAQLAFEEVIVLPNNKYKYNNRYQFTFHQKIDDRFYRNHPSNTIGLHLLTAYSGESDDLALGMLSAAEKSVVVRLSDDYAYLSETEEMKKIESFLNKPDLTNLLDYDVIRANKQKERNERSKRASDYVRMALETADFYVNGEKILSKTKDVTARVNEAFGKLVASEYSKLKDMETEPAQSDILEVLKKNKTQMTLDLSGVREPDQDALREMLGAIQYAGKTGAKFSIKQALDKFRLAPYGYLEEDVEYLIAVLYKKGQISLKMNSVLYSPANIAAEDIFSYLTKREYREKVLLEIKEMPKSRWIKAVKDVVRDFFGRSVVTDDSDTLMRDFKSYGEQKKQTLEKILQEEYGKGSVLPGRNILEEARQLLEDTCKIENPMAFYRKIFELYGAFDEVSVDLGDLQAFLGGVQKEKYKKACRTLALYEASQNYIVDSEINHYALQLREIQKVEKPYGLIQKMEEYDRLLSEAISELLGRDAGQILQEIRADRNIVMESIQNDRPYAGLLRKEFEESFQKLIDKLKSVGDMAVQHGIPSESSALLQNCLDRIAREEILYQKELASKRQRGGNEDPNGKGAEESRQVVQVKRTIPMTMRTLLGNRTYTICTEEEVDAFVEEIRRELKERLEEGAVIKLN